MDIEFSDALYNASAGQLLQIIITQPEELNSLMIIGHNPGLHELAFHLSRGGERDRQRQLAAAFPTCALAVINLDKWSDASGVLQLFVTPKELPDSL